jgi:hypothetical protein
MNARGGILLEAMIALALFVGAALTILRATSQAAAAVDKAATLQHAVDIATTRLAELETGIVSLADLQAGLDEPRPEFDVFDANTPSERLRVEARTERSIFAGLMLLELSVVDSEQAAFDGGARSIFTIRKLVRVREEEVDAYEQDDLLEDLPLGPNPIDEPEEESP